MGYHSTKSECARMKSRRSFKLENWMTNTFILHGLNDISLHSVGFELFKKVLLVSVGNSVKYITTRVGPTTRPICVNRPRLWDWPCLWVLHIIRPFHFSDIRSDNNNIKVNGHVCSDQTYFGFQPVWQTWNWKRFDHLFYSKLKPVYQTDQTKLGCGLFVWVVRIYVNLKKKNGGHRLWHGLQCTKIKLFLVIWIR